MAAMANSHALMVASRSLSVMPAYWSETIIGFSDSTAHDLAEHGEGCVVEFVLHC